MKLYFVRHGKTQWNLEGRFQGANGDSPLLETSIAELKELGKYLKEITFDQIYSSDLQRAKTTAQILNDANDHPTTIHYTKVLREWDLGNLEGQKISLVSAIYPKQMNAFRHNLAQFDNSMFNAESVYSVTQRISQFVKNLRNEKAQNILLVGHGAVLTASIQYLLGYNQAQLRRKGGLNNASVTILETKDFEHFDLITWNDTSYQEKMIAQIML
ncbi:histidine phosphatase family protein [Streptococcus macacae]|uniref:Phosphoglycerate mutase family protein n=1 Tax=Streptococcus macacae NCTC 11558 TaxID=764298 RepID=G5JYN7_9STRE|nr:histidine phosphatase family protein [Streptococcus macacae]EHJ53283.1 phosphoglycerate mutase family protein [Streptococcus macacae NCTC 11558]SUN78150.1 phosphoglycerate mutase [Streptococcus macacae NCTC 11558]